VRVVILHIAIGVPELNGCYHAKNERDFSAPNSVDDRVAY
jgi:hypothetical protein